MIRAIRESEERYRAIAEDTPVLICRFLPSSEIVYANESYCPYFDKTSEELVGTSFLSLIPEDNRKTVMADIVALTPDSPTQSHEHQVVASDGEIRWQRWTNRALFDASGQAVAYQSIELVTWSRRTLGEYCSAEGESHYPVREAGIWADALRRYEAVVFNDYPGYAHKRGLPEGHAELTRLISLPVLENGKVVMLAGVGNKSTDYADLDVETLQLIANAIWRIVQRRRSVIRLQANEARYRELVEKHDRRGRRVRGDRIRPGLRDPRAQPGRGADHRNGARSRHRPPPHRGIPEG